MEIFKQNYTSLFNVDQFQQFINKKEIIYEIQNYFVNRNMNKEYGKLLLTSFYLFGYYNDLNISKLDIIYISSKNIKQLYDNDLLTEQTMEQYKLYLNSYIEKDKKIEIKSLINQYNDINNTIENLKEKDQSDQIIIELTEHMIDRKTIIIDRLKFYNIDIFNTSSTFDVLDTLTGFEYIGDEISIMTKKIYYENYNMMNLIEDIKYIKNLLMNCTPMSYRNSLYNEYDLYIDIDFIHHQIENKVLNFHNLVYYIFEKIKFLDSSVGNEQIKLWLDNFNEINKFHYDYEEIVPFIIRDIINKLENIHYLITDFTNSAI